MNKEQEKQLQENIRYCFKCVDILRQALSHSSYTNERHMKKVANNERLEFLGDAVLEIITSEYLYVNFPNKQEGDLTKLRASIVCEQTLAICSRQIQLGSYLMLGKGEDMTGGRERNSILSDAMEAVIGAIYVDGGFASAKEFIERFILTDIEKKQLFYDSKTILQETVQGSGRGELHYDLISEEGPDHDKNFVVNAMIGNTCAGIGVGRTKKAAEQEAAYCALLKLREEP